MLVSGLEFLITHLLSPTGQIVARTPGMLDLSREGELKHFLPKSLSDAWDNGFLKFALRAPRRIWPHHRQGVSHRDLASHEFCKGFCRGLGAWELRQVMLFRKSEKASSA